MGILLTLAQYGYDYNSQYYTTSPTYSDGDVAALFAGAFVAFMMFGLVIAAISYVVTGLCLMRIFKKAGVTNAWAAWVPFYNTWKLLEIGGQQGFWAVLAIVPIVNIVSAVFMYIAMYHIGKKLGKEGVFVLLAIFLPLVWMIWLAVDHSTWKDSGSTAPSLDPSAAH